MNSWTGNLCNSVASPFYPLIVLMTLASGCGQDARVDQAKVGKTEERRESPDEVVNKDVSQNSADPTASAGEDSPDAFEMLDLEAAADEWRDWPKPEA